MIDLSLKYVNQELIKILENRSKQKRGSTSDATIADEVRQLLKRGANSNCRDSDGFTALQLAVKNQYHECLETLIIDGKAEIHRKGGP
jgi:hypothetical protein